MWGSNEAPVHQAWTDAELDQMMQDCADSQGSHYLYEVKERTPIPEAWGGGWLEPGDVHVACYTSGVVYAPPLHWLMLEDLLWPESWGQLDWPGLQG